jgi:hypothetical protein
LRSANNFLLSVIGSSDGARMENAQPVPLARTALLVG